MFSKCTAKSDPNAWNTRSLVSRYCIWASASNFVFIMLLMIISNNQHCARFFITVFDKVLGALCLKLKTRPMRISNNNNDGEKWMVWIWRDLNYVPLCIRIYSVRGACWVCVSARERNLEMEWQKIARERDFCFCFRQSERHSFCYFRFLSFVISHWLHTKRKLWLFFVGSLFRVTIYSEVFFLSHIMQKNNITYILDLNGTKQNNVKWTCSWCWCYTSIPARRIDLEHGWN